MRNVHIELTDTFGGEANYSWVRRHDIEMPDSASDLAIVRAAKCLLGMSGVRARVDRFGDMLAIYPRNACVVAFITFGDAEKG